MFGHFGFHYVIYNSERYVVEIAPGKQNQHHTIVPYIGSKYELMNYLYEVFYKKIVDYQSLLIIFKTKSKNSFKFVKKSYADLVAFHKSLENNNDVVAIISAGSSPDQMYHFVDKLSNKQI